MPTPSSLVISCGLSFRSFCKRMRRKLYINIILMLGSSPLYLTSIMFVLAAGVFILISGLGLSSWKSGSSSSKSGSGKGKVKRWLRVEEEVGG